MALQIVCAILIVAACFVSKTLVLVAGVISMAYMFSNAKWEQKIAFFMFLLSFSPIFKFDKGQTSLFMFLRIAIILSFMFQNKEKFSFKFITLVIAFFAYCFILSALNNTEFLTQLINIAIWTMIGYIFVNTLQSHSSTPVARCIMFGVIVTGFFGFFLDKMPALKEMTEVLYVLGADGAEIFRYAGFWKDPNYFTILLITAIWCIYFEYNKKHISITEFFLECITASFIGLMTMSKSCILLLALFWIYVIVSKNDIKTAPKVIILFLMIFAIIVFLWQNPYWISDILYRFSYAGEKTTMDTITTGRSDIWVEYLKSLFENFSWITGHGINADLLEIDGVNKVSHSIYIEMLYTFGICGTIIYISMFRSMYNCAKKQVDLNNRISNNPSKMLLFSILLAMAFLNGINCEIYYYILPLSFVYMVGGATDSSNIQDEFAEEQIAI